MDGVGGQRQGPAALHPVPIAYEARRAPGPVCTGAVSLAPQRFDPWTVQPVASRYTDCHVVYTLRV